jgi:hypothetical protein
MISNVSCIETGVVGDPPHELMLYYYTCAANGSRRIFLFWIHRL